MTYSLQYDEEERRRRWPAAAATRRAGPIPGAARPSAAAGGDGMGSNVGSFVIRVSSFVNESRNTIHESLFR